MTLDNLPTKTTKVFSQRDVRETPSSTATATSVGLTDPHYVTLQTDADLTNERVLTMGEGLDMTDAGAGSTLTLSGENATDTNKGIASFDLADFTVTTGAVALKAIVVTSIDGDSGTATPAVHNVDILGGTGIDTAGSGNDITISMEAASTTNVGGVELATVAETQTGADATRAVTPDGVQAVLCPIGAIVAWAKSMTGVPGTLPVGWRKCDGSAVNDAQSPMNGQNLPDLNGGEFLKGAATSGSTGGSTTSGSGSQHRHTTNFTTSDADVGDSYFAASGDSLFTSYESSHTHTAEPPFYTVVWIMRIK